MAAWPIGAAVDLAGLAGGLVVTGAVAGPIDVGVLILRQRRTDPALLGRALSVSMSLNLGGIPLGAALAGMILPWSVSASFLVAGMASVLGAVAAARLLPG